MLNKLIDFFKISEEDRKIIKTNILNENVRRVFYLSVIGIPISLLHVILFISHLKSSVGIEYEWRVSIITIHISIIILLSIISLTIYFAFIKKRSNIRLAEICIVAVALSLLFGGAAISAVDQKITTAINPFIATTIISSIILLIRHLVVHPIHTFP